MSITIPLSSQYPHDIDGLLWHGSHDILWVLSPGLEGHSHFQSQKTVGQLRNNTGLENKTGFSCVSLGNLPKKNEDSKNTKHDVLPNFQRTLLQRPCSKFWQLPKQQLATPIIAIHA